MRPVADAPSEMNSALGPFTPGYSGSRTLVAQILSTFSCASRSVRAVE